jgi:hypothetical protein
MMIPAQTDHGETGHRWRDTKSPTDLAVIVKGLIESFHFFHFRETQFRCSPFTVLRHAPFSTGVRRIFNYRSDKEVGWPNAKTVIAMMQYPFSVRDWSNMNLPRNSMGLFRSRWSPNRATSSTLYSASPNPTRANFRAMRWNRTIYIYLFPKSLFEGFCSTLRGRHRVSFQDSVFRSRRSSTLLRLRSLP